MGRDPRKIYRFALYGQSGSGKSCLLGAMALVGTSSRNLTCELLPVEVPRPQGPQDAQLTPEEQEALGLHRGKEWLDTVQAKLVQNDVPEPNPPVFDAAPPTFDFRIGEPRHGDRLVRLIDYSGELINPDLESDSESLVRKLRAHLAHSDGFLVLVEVPSSQTTLSQRRHLTRLRQAFKSLQEAKDDALRTPTCIVLTKWDRHSQIQRERPAEEVERTRKFLEDRSELQGVIHSIGNALAGSNEQDQNADVAQWGLRVGNVWVFPASAFGAAAQKDGKEVPAHDLEPFGILEPFVWLVEQRDALDVADLEDKWRRHRLWAWLPLACLLPPARRLPRRAARLARRIPRSADPRRRLASLRNRLRLVTFLSFTTSLLVCVIGYGGFRANSFAHYKSVVDNPATTAGDLQQARDFFDRYVARLWNGLFAPSREEAKQQLKMAENRLDDLSWQEVQKRPPLSQEQCEEAQKYLDRLPNGRHTSEAQQIISQCLKIQHERENEDWLRKCESKLVNARTSDDVMEVLGEIGAGFPHPGSANADQQRNLEKLRDEARKKRDAFDWAEFVKRYHDAMRQEEWAEAARLLADRHPRNADWRGLAREFASAVGQKARSRIDQKLREGQCSSARDTLDKAVEALKQVEQAVRAEQPEIADSMLEALRVLEPKKHQIDQEEDRSLYAKVQQQRSKPACDSYLQGAPLKTMDREVNVYRDYLEALEKPLSVEVEIRIFWDKNYAPDWGDAGENYVSVWLHDQTVFRSDKPIPEDPGNLSGVVGGFKILGKRRREEFALRVEITEDDWFLSFGDDDGGSGQQRCTLEDLHRGVQIPLRPQDGGNFENRADLTISQGWPQEPELPKWHE